MTSLANSLERQAHLLAHRWAKRLQRGASPSGSEAVLLDRPGALGDLVAVLSGHSPARYLVKTGQSSLYGPSLHPDALKDEYDELHRLVLDFVEAEGLELSMAEKLALTEFFCQAITAGTLVYTQRISVAQPSTHESSSQPPQAPDRGEMPVASVPAPGSPTGHRILVVDDNEDGADMLAELLRRRGHETRVARSGEETLEVASAFQPEVVFLDVELPGIDGYEVARRIRAQPSLASVFLVALTGRAREEDKKLSKAAGIDVHLTKPVAPEKLLVLLSEFARYTRPSAG